MMYTPAMSTVDSEQAEELLEEPMPSTRNKRAVLQLVLGVALVCALAGTLALCVGPTMSAPASPEFDGLDDFIRSYAAERGRSSLTDSEVKAITGFFEMKNSQRPSMRLGELRTLQEDGVSEECKAALLAGVKKIIRQLAKLAVDYAIDCWWGGEDSEACKETTEKIDKFDETIKEQCKASGDLCTITQTHPKKGGGNETETESFCMPQECHDEINQAQQLAAQQILQGETEAAAGRTGLGSHDFGKGLDVQIEC